MAVVLAREIHYQKQGVYLSHFVSFRMERLLRGVKCSRTKNFMNRLLPPQSVRKQRRLTY